MGTFWRGQYTLHLKLEIKCLIIKKILLKLKYMFETLLLSSIQIIKFCFHFSLKNTFYVEFLKNIKNVRKPYDTAKLLSYNYLKLNILDTVFKL